MRKLAVFVSGKGTIFRSIIDHPLPVHRVLADRTCPAILYAPETTEVVIIARKFYGMSAEDARRSLTENICEAFADYGPEDIIACAGFKSILDPIFFERVKATVLNTHPSLLPAYKGNDAVAQAFHAGEEMTGCTIHIMTPELDAGPVVAQVPVTIKKNDTMESLHERIKIEERKLYPRIIEEFLTGKRTAH